MTMQQYGALHKWIEDSSGGERDTFCYGDIIAATSLAREGAGERNVPPAGLVVCETSLVASLLSLLQCSSQREHHRRNDDATPIKRRLDLSLLKKRCLEDDDETKDDTWEVSTTLPYTPVELAVHHCFQKSDWLFCDPLLEGNSCTAPVEVKTTTLLRLAVQAGNISAIQDSDWVQSYLSHVKDGKLQQWIAKSDNSECLDVINYLREMDESYIKAIQEEGKTGERRSFRSIISSLSLLSSVGGPTKQTIVHTAAAHGHLATLQALADWEASFLPAGSIADSDVLRLECQGLKKDGLGYVALTDAASGGHLACCKFLVHHYRLNRADLFYAPAPVEAARTRDGSDGVEETTISSSSGRIPRPVSSSSNAVDRLWASASTTGVAPLLNQPTLLERSNCSPLHFAVLNGHLAVVKFLLYWFRITYTDIRYNLKDESASSLLHYAAANDRVEILRDCFVRRDNTAALPERSHGYSIAVDQEDEHSFQQRLIASFYRRELTGTESFSSRETVVHKPGAELLKTEHMMLQEESNAWVLQQCALFSENELLASTGPFTDCRDWKEMSVVEVAVKRNAKKVIEYLKNELKLPV